MNEEIICAALLLINIFIYIFIGIPSFGDKTTDGRRNILLLNIIIISSIIIGIYLYIK